MKELKDDDLMVLLERIISKAEDFSTSKLQKERDRVLEYYRGNKPAPLHAGDSQYVSRDVYDAIDSARSNLLETFSATQRIVKFRAEKDETVEQAKQATEYCRHVFYKDNRGEDLMYTAITDALMNRFSVAKVYYKEVKDELEHELGGLTGDELETFVADFYDFEFNALDSSALAQGLYSGTVTEIKLKRKICVEIIQPEDLRVLGRSATLQDAKAVVHTQEMTKSQLLKEGYDKKKVEKLEFTSKNPSTLDYEKSLRYQPIGDSLGDDGDIQDATNTITVHEIYAHLDMNQSGQANLWRIVYGGDVVFEKERIARMPFASFVPIPTPHTFFGENFGLAVMPIQNTRTIMMRQIVNHTVRTNNDRLMVLTGGLHNAKELLDNRQGGIVNVKRMDAIAPLPQSALNPHAFSLIQLLDEDKEEVTGISKLSQGLDKSAVSTQNAEGKIDQLVQLSMQRQKTFARRFGQFLCEVYWLIAATATDYISEDQYVSVTGSYVEVTPEDWVERTAASVELTLTQSERNDEAIKYREIDTYFSQHPKLGAQYTPDKQWEVISRMAENMGIEDVDKLLTRPEEVKPQEPSEAEKIQLETLRAQMELIKAQAASMLKKAETEFINAKTKAMQVEADVRAKGAKANLDDAKFQHDQEIDWAEVEAAKLADEQTGIWSPNS
jgi:hypothetical protein